MHRIYVRYTLLSLLLLVTQSAFAQKSNRENSPYSRFGIGELRNNGNAFLRGMGNVSAAYTSSFNVNTDNPASYASLQLTTYELAAEGNTRTVMAGNDKYKTGSATISYMNVGIPIGKFAGMALGYKPVSRMYYYLTDTSMVDSFGMGVKKYEGDGALSKGFIGFAGKYKGISLGFNFGYVFGNQVMVSSLEALNDTQRVLGSRFYTETRIGGIHWDAGVMYEFDITKKLFMRTGASIAISQPLHASRDRYWISYLYQADTAIKEIEQKGTIQLPMTYSVGALITGDNKWTVGLNYAGANWSNYTSYGLKDSLAASTYKMSIGLEYTPDAVSKSYFQKVTYRLGGYYGTDAVMLRNTQLDYYAFTAGMTLPFRKNIARLHTSIEVGARGTKNNGLVKESFVKFGIGLTLNDRWFIKAKYE